MHDLDICAVYDLGVPGKSEDLRQALLGKLNDETVSKYRFDHEGVEVYPIMGKLVRIEFRERAMGYTGMAAAFEGMCARGAEIKTTGTDHFPAAGLYDASTLPKRGISGASATVRWRLEHTYPLSEGTIEAAVRSVQDDSSLTQTIRLEVPVVYVRSWSLTLTAQTLKRALTAYKLLRSGEWTPATAFADALSDMEKLRVLQQTVTAEES